jgi:hypothetical protein
MHKFFLLKFGLRTVIPLCVAVYNPFYIPFFEALSLGNTLFAQTPTQATEEPSTDNSDAQTFFKNRLKPGHYTTTWLGAETLQWNVVDHSFGWKQNFNRNVTSEIGLGYVFVFRLVGGQGVGIGSQMGFLYDSRTYGNRFRPGWAISFPSLLVSTVHQLNHAFRLSFQAQLGARFYPFLKVRKPKDSGVQESGPELDSKWERVSHVPDSIRMGALWEWFTQRDKAYTLNMGYGRVWHSCVDTSCESANRPPLAIQANAWFLNLGTTFLLGDELAK